MGNGGVGGRAERVNELLVDWGVWLCRWPGGFKLNDVLRFIFIFFYFYFYFYFYFFLFFILFNLI